MRPKTKLKYDQTRALVNSGMKVREACQQTGMTQSFYYTLARLNRVKFSPKNRAKKKKPQPTLTNVEVHPPLGETRYEMGLEIEDYRNEKVVISISAGALSWLVKGIK